MPSILPPVHPFLPSLHSIPLLIPMSHCCDRKKTLIIQRLSWLLSLNTLQEDTRGPADGGASPESASKVTVCHCPPAPASSASTSLSRWLQAQLQAVQWHFLWADCVPGTVLGLLWTLTLNSHTWPMRSLSSSFYKWGNWGTNRLNNLPMWQRLSGSSIQILNCHTVRSPLLWASVFFSTAKQMRDSMKWFLDPSNIYGLCIFLCLCNSACKEWWLF